MPKYLLTLSITILLLAGCDVKDGSGSEKSDTTYVNSVTGIDSAGNGKSRAKPYKTITFALAQENTKSEIELAIGVYNIASGEQFPIVIPRGKKLVGESINVSKKKFALVSGTGGYDSNFINGINNVSVVFNHATEVRDLVIESVNGVALWIENSVPKSRIVNLGLMNSNIGITIVGEASPQILNSRIEQNMFSGVEILGSAAPIILNNSITQNNVGVFVSDDARPEFSLSSSGGGNLFFDNTLCDFLHSGIATLNVIGTRWDQDVFDFSIASSCIDGAEIAIDGAGSINYQFIPPENNLIFQNTNRIPLVEPKFGEIIFSRQPQFVWSSTGPNTSMIAVWEQPPVIGTKEIQDSVPIYWFWHSGLNTGGNGFVQHHDGKTTLGGSIEKPRSPVLFETGRSYYWAVWEWDDRQRNIIASSSLNYFRVQ